MTARDTPFAPDWVSPPGDTIADLLEERGWTAVDLASRLDCPPEQVSRLIDGRESVSEDTAERLAQTLGSTPGFWLRREAGYRERIRENDELDD
jgi:HTH-type transcriptional regulator/antitoxin HigA